MTAKDRTCEVCGNSEFYAGVASSGLAPMSLAWCFLCLNMGAEMEFLVLSTVECCGGIEHVHEKAGLVYYDRQKESYIDYRSKEVIPIKTVDGKQFSTRTEYMQHYHQRQKELKI